MFCCRTQLNHGEWMPWVEENLSVTANWTSQIIKLADNENLIEGNSTSLVNSITKALKFIREEESKNKPEPESPLQSELDKKLRVKIENQIKHK